VVAYDEDLADRVRGVFGEGGVHPVEQRMFGGLAFMVSGHLTVGVLGDEIIVRVGRDAYEDALRLPHAREMDLTGRPMTGIVHVGAEGIAEDEELRAWIRRGLDFTGSLPPK
jgi:hypothetical protein